MRNLYHDFGNSDKIPAGAVGAVRVCGDGAHSPPVRMLAQSDIGHVFSITTFEKSTSACLGAAVFGLQPRLMHVSASQQ